MIEIPKLNICFIQNQALAEAESEAHQLRKKYDDKDDNLVAVSRRIERRMLLPDKSGTGNTNVGASNSSDSFDTSSYQDVGRIVKLVDVRDR